ncbi:hypothetical protein P691DRAFT_384795 [Macrolepiota fuliginosa MF-IS2]|uniref:Uncharacterized protein n=1 Tax=Macrolepiota fuliginosa MF-IS2 TaxID=1400762 RepID=A0A9P6BZN4_9AGAR|nr:hypothetical protein P691DRAFT_384795 [Macrolepiota fuliginosa MF-IS2]
MAFNSLVSSLSPVVSVEFKPQPNPLPSPAKPSERREIPPFLVMPSTIQGDSHASTNTPRRVSLDALNASGALHPESKHDLPAFNHAGVNPEVVLSSRGCAYPYSEW